MKQHLEHCVGAAQKYRAMTCHICDMTFASIAGFKQHTDHIHGGDQAAIEYNHKMDAYYAVKRQGDQGKEGPAETKPRKAPEAEENKGSHSTIKKALAWGPVKTSPGKERKRFFCIFCSGTFTRMDSMKAHMFKLHGMEISSPSGGGRRCSTPTSMAPASRMDSSPSIVPTNLTDVSPAAGGHQINAPIVIEPSDGAREGQVG